MALTDESLQALQVLQQTCFTRFDEIAEKKKQKNTYEGMQQDLHKLRI